LRKLGRSAVDVSAIGFGTMSLSLEDRPPEAAAIEVICAALDEGIRLIDTADVYALDDGEIGHGERLIAKALREWAGDESDVVVATKGGIEHPDAPVVAKRASRASPRRVRAQPEALGAIPSRLPVVGAGSERSVRRHDGRARSPPAGGQDPARRALERVLEGSRPGRRDRADRERAEPHEPVRSHELALRHRAGLRGARHRFLAHTPPAASASATRSARADRSTSSRASTRPRRRPWVSLAPLEGRRADRWRYARRQCRESARAASLQLRPADLSALDQALGA
jgi:hypothetical protein